jgi:hypothetical protein
MMVRKKNGKWRMYTNFTYLNKCCPKDDFPFARIDKIVDSTACCEMMALLDYFSGTIKSGSAKRSKRRPVSSLLLEHIVTSECPKVYAMLDQHSA